MTYIYKLLQSPIFGMSSPEALMWIDKCLCHEHEDFHVNLKFHQNLYTELRRFAAHFDYLWPINQEMSLMAKGGSIHRAIKNNIKNFKQFSKSVSASV